MRIGTAHFVSLRHAEKYYARQDIGPDEVAQKVADGEISLGKPAFKPGDLSKKQVMNLVNVQ